MRRKPADSGTGRPSASPTAAHTALAWTSSPSAPEMVVVRSAQRGPVPEQKVRIVSRSPVPGRDEMDSSHRRSSQTTGSTSPASARSSSAADCRYRAIESNRSRPAGATSVLRTIRRVSYTRPLAGASTNGGGNESISPFSRTPPRSRRRGSADTARMPSRARQPAPCGMKEPMRPAELQLLTSLEDRHWWYRERRAILARQLRGLPAAGRALDIGAAGGGNTRVLRQHGWEAVALEYSDSVADVAKARGISAIRADARSLPLDTGTCGLVTAFDILEHIDEDYLAAAEISRVLRPGGTALIAVPCDMALWSAHDDE